jgi:hypothetical protein
LRGLRHTHAIGLARRDFKSTVLAVGWSKGVW